MGMKFNKTDLLNAMKGFGYVTTTSGPVKPAKAKIIDVMTKQIMKPVTKPQDSADWDDRRYEMNSALTSNHKYMTVKDMYSKVAKAVTEATTKTPYHGMRLNLKSIDMEETHCKFIITRHEVKVMVELYFPNANGAVSVHISTETGLSNLYEVELDSDQFKINFGISILKSIDELMHSESDYSISDDLDTMDYTNGMGTSMRDVNDTIVQPSALIRESVDGNLSKLLHLCNAITEAGDDPAAQGGDDQQAAGAEQFNMDPNGAPSPNDMSASMSATPVNGGDVNGTNGQGDDAQQVNIKDYLLSDGVKKKFTLFDSGTDTGTGGGIGNLAKLLSQKKESMNEKLSADEHLNGNLGIKNQKPEAIIADFCNLFSELCNSSVTDKQCDELIEYLNDPREDVNLKNFDLKLQKIFPDVYDNGNQSVTQFFDMGNLPLDGEDQIMNPTSFNDSEPVDFDSALSMSTSNDTQPDYNNDGSMSAMVDMLGQQSVADDGSSEPDESAIGDTTPQSADTAAFPQI